MKYRYLLRDLWRVLVNIGHPPTPAGWENARINRDGSVGPVWTHKPTTITSKR